jgi:hypothetical protein
VLNDFLFENLTTVEPRGIEGNKSKEYLRKWKQLAKKKLAQNPDVMTYCVDGSRDPAGAYNSTLMADLTPSFTTQNRKLLVFGRKAPPNAPFVQKVPEGGRYLTVKERANSLGFVFSRWESPFNNASDPFEHHYDLMCATMSEAQLQKALGNAQIVNCMGLVLQHCWDYVDAVLFQIEGSPVAPLTGAFMDRVTMKRRRLLTKSPPSDHWAKEVQSAMCGHVCSMCGLTLDQDDADGTDHYHCGHCGVIVRCGVCLNRQCENPFEPASAQVPAEFDQRELEWPLRAVVEHWEEGRMRCMSITRAVEHCAG